MAMHKKLLTGANVCIQYGLSEYNLRKHAGMQVLTVVFSLCAIGSVVAQTVITVAHIAAVKLTTPAM